jgi:hypothetical protein
MAAYRVGCAGWVLPKSHQPAFPEEGSHLERYAGRFTAVEINSSFYRPHSPATYARWAASVPTDFRFSVKVPRAITHDQRLVATDVLLDVFLSEARALGEKLGCLLVQLPPSLAYDAATAESFFNDLRTQYQGTVALEAGTRVGSRATLKRGCAPIALRESRPTRLRSRLRRSRRDGPRSSTCGFTAHRESTTPRTTSSTWICWASACAMRQPAPTTSGAIFDNTAFGAAVPNALGLMARLSSDS